MWASVPGHFSRTPIPTITTDCYEATIISHGSNANLFQLYSSSPLLLESYSRSSAWTSARSPASSRCSLFPRTSSRTCSRLLWTLETFLGNYIHYLSVAKTVSAKANNSLMSITMYIGKNILNSREHSKEIFCTNEHVVSNRK